MYCVLFIAIALQIHLLKKYFVISLILHSKYDLELSFNIVTQDIFYNMLFSNISN